MSTLRKGHQAHAHEQAELEFSPVEPVALGLQQLNGQPQHQQGP